MQIVHLIVITARVELCVPLAAQAIDYIIIFATILVQRGLMLILEQLVQVIFFK